MEFFDIHQAYYLFRMIAASICGIMIGLERKNRSKEAGVRTHCVVACAAALMMIVSKYAFFDLIENSMYAVANIKLDPSRVASTIASGIGFLGAGMIFVHKNTVTGLTTAAGIWATSGVGMAIGAGMYFVGVSATIILIFAQVLLHKNFKWLKTSKMKKISIKNVTCTDFQSRTTAMFNAMGIQVFDVCIEKKEDFRNYIFTIDIPQNICEDDIISSISYNCSICAGV